MFRAPASDGEPCFYTRRSRDETGLYRSVVLLSRSGTAADCGRGALAPACSEGPTSEFGWVPHLPVRGCVAAVREGRASSWRSGWLGHRSPQLQARRVRAHVLQNLGDPLSFRPKSRRLRLPGSRIVKRTF